MGLKLCFQDDEMKAVKASNTKCELCKERAVTWKAKPIQEDEDPILVCAHCAMYSTKTKWGHENKEDLLHIGRYCQAHALKNKREVPQIDERGRLEPMEAEKFMMGVAYTTLIIRKMNRLGAVPESGNTSS